MIIYTTKYQAYKNRLSNERVVKVSGGYTVMDPRDYRDWKNQK